MTQRTEHGAGLASALAAFGIWGFLPLYFHLIGPRVSVWEVLSHRIVWATVLLATYTVFSGRFSGLRAVFASPRVLLALAASAVCIGLNWVVFIWAVTHGHVLESSMGYYITPLLNVVMGMLFLGERLRPLQWLAVALAALGVAIMIGAYGTVPWVALTLASAFGFYGLIRKQVAVDSPTGLLTETLLLLPLAFALLAWVYEQHELTFLHTSPTMDLLLVGAGVVTVVPLLLFATGARRLRLGTIGLLQYLTPTMQFLTGVFLLGEPFTRADGLTFACIWSALVLYSIDAVHLNARRMPK
ncbi:MAG TPA: EamA family transporter RarD [Gammaproteobacteria bacterium]|nr:EamA family transporter RarD [Gammaproteobacteria bacterium]